MAKNRDPPPVPGRRLVPDTPDFFVFPKNNIRPAATPETPQGDNPNDYGESVGVGTPARYGVFLTEGP